MVRITMQVRHAEPGKLFEVKGIFNEKDKPAPWLRYGEAAWLIAGLLRFGRDPIIYYDGHPYEIDSKISVEKTMDESRHARISLLSKTREICLEHFHLYVERIEEKVLFSKDAATSGLQKRAQAIVFPDVNLEMCKATIMNRLESLRIGLIIPTVPVFLIAPSPKTLVHIPETSSMESHDA
jgi:hypothetical protein